MNRTMNSNRVLDILTQRITYLDYKPGESLNEKKIAEELAISRTPVREALLILKSESLVGILPQSGTFVSRIDLNYVRELVHMRHVLETDILLELAKKGKPIQPFTEKYLYLQELALNTNNTIEFINNDDEFHRTLFELAEHPIIWDIIAKTRCHHTRFRILDLQLPSALKESLSEHRQIINCLENGKTKELKKILKYHHDCELRNASKIMKQYPDFFY